MWYIDLAYLRDVDVLGIGGAKQVKSSVMYKSAIDPDAVVAHGGDEPATVAPARAACGQRAAFCYYQSIVRKMRSTSASSFVTPICGAQLPASEPDHAQQILPLQ
jgi:hypothetical protein